LLSWSPRFSQQLKVFFNFCFPYKNCLPQLHSWDQISLLLKLWISWKILQYFYKIFDLLFVLLSLWKTWLPILWNSIAWSIPSFPMCWKSLFFLSFGHVFRLVLYNCSYLKCVLYVRGFQKTGNSHYSHTIPFLDIA
jgi:hypothetical protein